jgi:hypothetical protein
MRLYPRAGATAAVDDAGEHFTAGDDGGFDFPEPVGERLHSTFAAGKPLWETQTEQQNRMMGEELERRKDPATLLAAVEQLVAAAKATRPAEAEPGPAPVKATVKTSPAKVAAK